MKENEIDLESNTPVVDSEKEVNQAVNSTDDLSKEDSERSNDTADDTAAKLEKANAEIEKQKNEYLFLRAEFDNFRKRTLKEKSELLLNGGEKAFKGLLPVVDDFERAISAANNTNDIDSLREGLNLIYTKFVKYLNNNGVKKIDSINQTFDTDYHEALTLFPVDDEDKKGKVIDVVEEGYVLNDKVIRHAKVVVGQ